jgi:RNA-splicing ligase RtcB
MPHNGAINCASRERQGDRDLWVGPPGATPAFPGQRGVVSSTGNDALILEGVENAEAAWSFYSTAHGAGRLFDRRDAKRQLWRPETNAWTSCCGVMLIGADSMSPMVYRRCPTCSRRMPVRSSFCTRCDRSLW